MHEEANTCSAYAMRCLNLPMYSGSRYTHLFRTLLIYPRFCGVGYG